MSGLETREASERDDIPEEGRTAVFLIELRDLYRVIEVLGDSAAEMIGGEVTERVRDVVTAETPVARAGSAQYVTVASAPDDDAARKLGVWIRQALRGELEIPGGGISFAVAVSVVTIRGGIVAATTDDRMIQRARAGLQAARWSRDGVFLVSDSA